MRYHLIHTSQMAIIKNSKTNKCWIGCGKKGTLLHSWWECKLIQPLWRIVLKCFLKIRNKTTIWHKQYHYWAYTLKKTIVQKDTCTPTFNVALFTIARTLKQRRCPSTDEWIKKLWYIYTMQYYSAIKRNEFESTLMRWMNLEPVIQSWNRKIKNKCHIITYIWNLENVTDELFCRAGIETQTQRRDWWMQWGKEWVGQTETVALKHIHYRM